MKLDFILGNRSVHVVGSSVHAPDLLFENLRSMGEGMDTDVWTTAQSVFAVLVYRYTGREDLEILVNSQPLRVLLTGDLTIGEVIRRVRAVSNVTMVDVQELSLTFPESDQECNTSVQEHFLVVLQGIVANADRPIASLPLLTSTERQLLMDLNLTAVEYPQDACLHELFEAQVKQTPQAVAVVSGRDELTYQELNARANQVGHYLRELGVQPGELVGILMERSLDMMVGLLGILKAGGTYVPLDPSYPKSRLQLILEEAKLATLVTKSKWRADLPEPVQNLLCLDTEAPALALEATSNLERLTSPEQCAYVIFTSGSTGRPKGVQVPHSAVVNLLHSMRKNPGISEEDVFLALASFSFDMSIPELYLPLITGAKLVLGRQGIAGDGEALADLIRRERVSIMQATPTTWRLLLEAGLQSDGRLRVLCGAEPLLPQLAEDLLAVGFEVWNLYGPTETTVWSMIHRLERGKAGVVPIGTPMDNTEIYILNQDLQQVPVGVAGELVIGGAGLTKGYLNRPDLTDEKFIPHPFCEQPGARLYRTGDLVRFTSDGEIEYLGRLDHQVKIRGFRVELGEIEAHLESHSSVRGAVVMARSDNHGNQRLVGYVQLHAGEKETGAELRLFLHERLPAYMVPTAFLLVESFPLNPNGKVDRNALQTLELDPQAVVGTVEYVAPRNETEQLLTEILGEILHGVRVGITDQFLALGGDSLMAARAVSRIRRVLSVNVEVRHLLEAQTIEAFASKISDTLVQKGPQEPRLRPVHREGLIPLSFSQRRLWFLDQLEEGRTVFYNLPLVWRIRGSLDQEAVERCLHEIVLRHEPLRTTFSSRGGQPVQVISEPKQTPLDVLDIRRRSADEQQRVLDAVTREEAAWRFELNTGPLFRARLVRVDEQEHVLFLNMHHIISDGWSLGLLLREFVMLYDSYVENLDSPLSELSIQYADYCVWQLEHMAGEVLEHHLTYWRNKLSGMLPILELPVDRSRGERQTFNGGGVQFLLSEECVRSIREFGKRNSFTPFMILLTAYNLLLSHTAKVEDVLVGSPVANRDSEELEGLIGFFVNTLVYRTNLSGDPTLREVLERVRETAYEAYAHQATPFEKVVEALQPKRDLRFPPIFQVWFVLHNTPDVAVKSRHLEFESVPVETGTVQFDLSLAVEDKGATMAGTLSYNRDLFDAESIQLLVDLFVEIVRILIEQPNLPASALYQTMQQETDRRRAAKQRSFKESRLASVKKRAVKPVTQSDMKGVAE